MNADATSEDRWIASIVTYGHMQKCDVEESRSMLARSPWSRAASVSPACSTSRSSRITRGALIVSYDSAPGGRRPPQPWPARCRPLGAHPRTRGPGRPTADRQPPAARALRHLPRVGAVPSAPSRSPLAVFHGSRTTPVSTRSPERAARLSVPVQPAPGPLR